MHSLWGRSKRVRDRLEIGLSTGTRNAQAPEHVHIGEDDEGRCAVIAGLAMLVLALGAVLMVAIGPNGRG